MTAGSTTMGTVGIDFALYKLMPLKVMLDLLLRYCNQNSRPPGLALSQFDQMPLITPCLRGPHTRAYGLSLFHWEWHTTQSIKHQSSAFVG